MAHHFFGRDGVSGHEEDESPLAVARRAVNYTHRKFSILSEDEFNLITNSLDFIDGNKKVEYVALENHLRLRFGYGDDIMATITEARLAGSIDGSIEILRTKIHHLTANNPPLTENGVVISWPNQ